MKLIGTTLTVLVAGLLITAALSTGCVGNSDQNDDAIFHQTIMKLHGDITESYMKWLDEAKQLNFYQVKIDVADMNDDLDYYSKMIRSCRVSEPLVPIQQLYIEALDDQMECVYYIEVSADAGIIGDYDDCLKYMEKAIAAHKLYSEKSITALENIVNYYSNA